MVHRPRIISILRSLIDSGSHPDKLWDLVSSILKSIKEFHVIQNLEPGSNHTKSTGWSSILNLQENAGLFDFDLCSPSFKVSTGLAKIAGYENIEVISREEACRHFISFTDQKLITRTCVENYGNKTPFTFSFFLTKIDGSVLNLKVTACYRFENGEVVGLFGHVQNVEISGHDELLDNSGVLFKSVFDSSPLARVVLDRSLNVLINNPNATDLSRRLWGIQPVIGQPITEFLPGAAGALFQQLLRRVVRGEKIRQQVQIETPILGPRWMDVDMNPVAHIDQQTVIGVVINLRDVTEVKLQNEAAEDANRRLHLALAVTKAANWEYNIELGTYWWSKEHYDLFNMAPTILPTLNNWLDSILPADRDKVEKAVARSIMYKEDLSITFRIPSNWEGRNRWISCNGKVHFDEISRTHRLIAIEIDITEQKENSAQRTYAEQSYQDLVRIIPVGVFKTNLEGFCYYINERCSQIIGLDEVKAAGFGWTANLDPDDYLRLSNAMRSALEKEELQVTEENLRFVWAGQEITAVAHIKVETDINGSPTGFVGSLTDVSQLIKADRKLKKLNEVLIIQYNKLRKYAHINSHDLRGPLTTMMSILNLLRNNDAQLDHDFIDALLKSSDKMDMVIKELNELLKDVEFEQIVEDNFELNSNVKVAMIDDDVFQNMVNSKIIQNVNSSIEVMEFTDAKVALDAILSRECTPDFILLDLNMPELDGWAFLDELEKSHIDIQTHILTSSINPSDFVRAKSYRNVKGFLSKPLRPELVDAVLSKFIPIR